MALIWIDGFDHYGTGATGINEMLDGVYSSTNAGPSSLQSRTGSNSLLISGNTSWKRILGESKLTFGVGMAIYPSSIPSGDDQMRFLEAFDSAGSYQFNCYVTATGAIKIERGNSGGAQIGLSADGVISASSWNHVETKAFIDDVSGSIEVRVNGVTVISESGIDTKATALDGVAIIGSGNAVAAASYYIDDIFVYDDQGTENNDWMGDLRVKTIMPNDDTAQADWLKSSGATGYTLINEIPADDDTTYIYNEAFGDGGEVSEFELEDIVGAIASIRGVQTYAKQRKTVAGTCNTQVSVVSGTSVSLGTDRPITEAYTYWMDVHELDPATGAPWTQSAINAMKLRVERTA